MTDVDLLPQQYDMLTSQEPNVAFIGAVGTGKTLTLAYTLIAYIALYPKAKCMVVANTVSQLLNSTLSVIIEVLDELNIPHKTSLGVRKTITINGSTVYLYSLEKPDTIKGIEVSLILGDEFFLGKSKYAYDVIKTRLRGKHGPLYFRAFTTKNGFNWGYDLYASPTKTNNFKTIEMQTHDNPFLPDQFLEDLLDDYGSVEAPMYKQEVLNEYVNLTAGAVYYSFDRDVHVKPVKLDKTRHVYIGIDFNISVLNAVYVQYYDNTFYVTSELHHEENGANTFLLAEKLTEDLFDCPYRSVIPDSTGKARKTSSAKSDHQILRDAGFQIEPTHNPLIRDRQNAVNRAFHQGRIVIDPSATQLIKELETLASRDEEGKVVDISVAFGYVIWKLDPLRKPQSRSRSYVL